MYLNCRLFLAAVMNSKFNRRKIGGRPYVPYTAEKMELCLSEIIGKKLTQREASAKYNIPRSTLILKMKAIRNDNVQLPGRTCVFTREEEDSFVDHIVKMCDFGFPVTPLDLRFIVKTYLDSTGRKEERFTNNMPGKRWAESFLYRHKKTLSHRFGSNIKRNRAMVNEEILGNFFDNLEKEVENVPPENIFNFDETNLVDDPGKKKILCRRGCKYPEIIKNSTKAAVSVMMCGNAAGEMCPPYINYKAEKMWDTWTEGGPEGARYNRTKSGWFDCNSFEDWFFTTLFPRLRKLSGKKVVIGDNLSSHISDKVLRACLANNVAFVALPPNATHLVQPLDVAYFRPMKVGWRQVLDGWKSTPLGTRLPSIPKDTFPSLLKELIEKLAVNGPSNLRSGFRKTGIFPTDRMQVLGRLPSTRPACNIEAISSSFVEHLNTLRAGDNVATPKRKRSKVNVEPGKSIGPEDIANRNVNAEGTNNGPTNDLLAAGPSQTQTFREKKRRQVCCCKYLYHCILLEHSLACFCKLSLFVCRNSKKEAVTTAALKMRITSFSNLTQTLISTNQKKIRKCFLKSVLMILQ